MSPYVPVLHWVLSGLITIAAVMACGGQSDSEKASDLARQWVSGNTDAAVEAVARTAVGLIIEQDSAPARLSEDMLARLIADQVEDAVRWDYSEPAKSSGRDYVVTVTASAELEFTIPLLGAKAYQASLPLILTVNTDEERVTKWSVDLAAASVREKP